METEDSTHTFTRTNRIIDACRRADEGYFDKLRDVDLSYEVRSTASCARCELFYVGTKSGYVYELTTRGLPRKEDAKPLNLRAPVRSISVVCSADGQNGEQHKRAHRVFIGADNGLIWVGGAGLVEGRTLCATQDGFQELSGDVPKASPAFAITHLSALSPPTDDCVDPDPHELSNDEPCESGKHLVLVGQRNGLVRVLEFRLSDRAENVPWYSVRYTADIGDWVRNAFYLPFHVTKGKGTESRHFVVVVTDSGCIHELLLTDIRAANPSHVVKLKPRMSIPRFPIASLVFRKRGHRNYTLLIGTDDGIWRVRPHRMMAEPIGVAAEMGPVLSLAKVKTYDRYYVFAGTYGGLIHAFAVAPPDSEILLDHLGRRFTLAVTDQPRVLSLCFARTTAAAAHEPWRARKAGEKTFLLAGVDSHKAVFYEVTDRVAGEGDSRSELEALVGVRGSVSPLDALADWVATPAMGDPEETSDEVPRSIARYVLPRVLEGLTQDSAGDAQIQLKLAQIFEKLMKDRDARTTRTAARLLEQYQSVMSAELIKRITMILVGNLGPFDERPSSIQPNRRVLEKAMRAVAAAAADTERKDRLDLVVWRQFLDKFVLHGHTYSSKRRDKLALARANQDATNYLDALIYYSQLLFQRFDQRWETDTEGPVWSLVPATSCGVELILTVDAGGEGGRGSVRAFRRDDGRAFDIKISGEVARLTGHMDGLCPPKETSEASATALVLRTPQYSRVLSLISDGNGGAATVLVAWTRAGVAKAPRIEILELSIEKAKVSGPDSDQAEAKEFASFRSKVLLATEAEVYAACVLDEETVLLGLQGPRAKLAVVRQCEGSWRILDVSAPERVDYRESDDDTYEPTWAIAKMTKAPGESSAVVAVGGGHGVLRIVRVQWNDTTATAEELWRDRINGVIRTIAFSNRRLLVGDELGGLRCFMVEDDTFKRVRLEWADSLSGVVRSAAFHYVAEYGCEVAVVGDERGHLAIYALEAAERPASAPPYERFLRPGSRLDRINLVARTAPSAREFADPLEIGTFAIEPSRMTGANGSPATWIIAGTDRSVVRLQLVYLKKTSARQALRLDMENMFNHMREADIIPEPLGNAKAATRRQLLACWMASLHPPVLWMTTARWFREDKRIRDRLRNRSWSAEMRHPLYRHVLRKPDYYHETLKVFLKRYLRAVLYDSPKGEDIPDDSERIIWLLQVLRWTEAIFGKWRGKKLEQLRSVFYREAASPTLLRLLCRPPGTSNEGRAFADEIEARIKELTASPHRGAAIEIVRNLGDAFAELEKQGLSEQQQAFSEDGLGWLAKNAAALLREVGDDVWTPQEHEVLRLLECIFRALPWLTMRLCRVIARQGIGFIVIEKLGDRLKGSHVGSAFAAYFSKWSSESPVEPRVPSGLQLDAVERDVYLKMRGRLQRLAMQRESEEWKDPPPDCKDAGEEVLVALHRIHEVCVPYAVTPGHRKTQLEEIEAARRRVAEGEGEVFPAPEPERDLLLQKLAAWRICIEKRQTGPFPTRNGKTPILITDRFEGTEIIVDVQSELPQFEWRSRRAELEAARHALAMKVKAIALERGAQPGPYETHLITGSRILRLGMIQQLKEQIASDEEMRPLHRLVKDLSSFSKRTQGDFLFVSGALASIPWRILVSGDTFLGEEYFAAAVNSDDKYAPAALGDPGRPLRVMAAISPDMRDLIGGGDDFSREHEQCLMDLRDEGKIELLGDGDGILRDEDAVADAFSALEETSQPDIIYFFCHGSPISWTGGPTDPRVEPAAFRLMGGGAGNLDTGVRIDELAEVLEGRTLSRRPLVIANACYGGVFYADHLRLASTGFRKMGASAVVGPVTGVPVRVCHYLGMDLLRKFAAGHSIGDCLHECSREMLREFNDPCGLLYNLYGAPSLRRS